ncbi:hypothetical protein IEO21_05918 [Rhodonia placenta]|uniref:Beta-lactamase-related domain-containing protein n=1 Tax=Rhodonia placenta TaxID=104341 RepID=A0A8H7P126_9APHY|nr:hypothetical protein IEO21_05918 [Postia placenta]
MFFCPVVLFVLALALCSLSSSHPSRFFGTPEPGWAITPAISLLTQKVLAEWGIHGSAVGVVRLTDTGQVETDLGSWGIMSEDGKLVSVDTLFSVGTSSKSFLPAAMAILIDDFARGRNNTPLPSGLDVLTWDTRIRELFPGHSEWALQNPNAQANVTIRDALEQRVGIQSNPLFFGREDKPLDVVIRLRHLVPLGDSRTFTSVSHETFTLAAHIITTLSGIPYTQFAQERIFSPVGMSATTFSGTAATRSGLLSEGWNEHGRRVPHWLPDTAEEVMAGSHGLISSAHDLTKWIAVLLNHGVNPGTNESVLPCSVLVETLGSRHVVLLEPNDYIEEPNLMGWRDTMYFYGYDDDIVSNIIVVNWAAESYGSVPGARTHIVLSPSDKLGVVILMNGHMIPGTPTIIHKIIEDLLYLPSNASRLGMSNIVAETPIPQPLSWTHIAQEDAIDLVDSTSLDVTDKVPEDNSPPEQRLMTINTQTETSWYSLHAGKLSVPLEQFAGQYASPAFGTLTLCALNSSSDECAAVLRDFAACGELKEHMPALYAAWPGVFVSHLRWEHIGNNAWSVVPLTLYPDGFGRDRTPFTDSTEGEQVAECVVREDHVLGCGLWDAGQPGPNATVADAWFTKFA